MIEKSHVTLDGMVREAQRVMEQETSMNHYNESKLEVSISYLQVTHLSY